MPPGGMRAMRGLRQDASVVKETVRPGTTKRILKFALAYAGLLAFFLLLVILDAIVGIANPLIYRSIINDGILQGNAKLVINLALLVGALAILDAGFGFAQSYLSAKVGNAIVLSMRTKL